MTMTRRELVRGGAAAGALLLARPSGALATALGPAREFGTSRASRLSPGTRLVHADLHNHTLFSDGDGDPGAAFASMRGAGLDVAALTDHATLSWGASSCGCAEGVGGIDEEKWQAVRGLADAANTDGGFAAIRGFEWSSPTLGHMNVWFSEQWIDPAHTGGTSLGAGFGQTIHDAPVAGPLLSRPVSDTFRGSPARDLEMKGWYDWLAAPSGSPVVGGGADGIAGFNHPGREAGRFGYFAYDARLRERIVSIEVFNRGEDYLYEGTDAGERSPISECLDAGWKVGLLGVTDEHGTSWGYPDGKGRTGLWVKELSRAGVREAMVARRFFSTRLRGLRLDATANGTRMGSVLRHRAGTVRFRLDVDRGPAFTGQRLLVQVLGAGGDLPRVLETFELAVPGAGRPVAHFDVPVKASDTPWLVLRLTDPSVKADSRATGAYATAGNAIAYASPFFLDPS